MAVSSRTPSSQTLNIMKKNLELQRLYENYLEAQGELVDMLEEMTDKISVDDNRDLWLFVMDVYDSFEHDGNGMEVLIEKKPITFRNKMGELVKLNHSQS